MNQKPGTRDRILSRLAERINESGGSVRKDLTVVTYTDIGEDAVRVAATYIGETPSFEEIRNWAIATGNGTIKILAQTMMNHDVMPYPMVTFVAQANKIRKPLKTALNEKNMVCIAKNTYMDTDLGVTWSQEEVNGKKFLVRVQQDGLQSALEAVASSKGPKTRKAAMSVLAAVAYAKDKVRYVRPDMSVGFGTVVQVHEDGIRVIKDDSTHNLYDRAMGCILEIVKRGSGSNAADKAVTDYHAQYLGTDLARQMSS